MPKGIFLKAIKAKAALGTQPNRLPSGPYNAIVWSLFYAALTRPYKKRPKKYKETGQHSLIFICLLFAHFAVFNLRLQ